MKKLISLTLILLPLMLLAHTVTASVNSLEIELGGRFEYTLQITHDKEMHFSEIAPPKIDGMIYINMSSSTSSSHSLINGKFIAEHRKSYTYYFSPQQEGKIHIPPRRLGIANKVYTTQSFDITVVRQSSSGTQRRSVSPFGSYGYDDDYLSWGGGRITGETEIVASFDKQKVYIGEPLIVSYHLYTDQMVRSFSLKHESDSPGYGKSIMQQPDNLDFETVQHKGKRMQRALLKELVLIPRQLGSLRIPRLGGKARIYEYGYMNVDFVSGDKSFEVIPLPTQNVPKSFSGAVGTFDPVGRLSDDDIALGDVIHYELTIYGVGNFNHFGNPEFPPDSAQITSPASIDNLDAGIDGSRLLYYTIVPREKGSYKMPRLEFSWFDPADGKYHTFRSEPHVIKVKSANVTSYLSGLLDGDKPATIRPMLSRAGYPSLRLIFHKVWYWLALALILIATFALWRFSRKLAHKRRDPRAFRIQRAERKLRGEIDKVQNLAKSLDSEFYAFAENALSVYLFDKYEIAPGIAKSEKLEILREKEIEDSLISEIDGFLELCTASRFQPQKTESPQISTDFVLFRELVMHIVRNGGKR